jgi:glycosyltransferase involved in cell wall biosynthesis
VKIALIGTRGVPANYGGFETCAEEIAVGLAARGHDVTAYCRPGNAEGDPAEYQGVKLIYQPFIDSKLLSTFSHTFHCLRHARKQDFDVLMVFNAGNSPLTIIPRLRGELMAINVDGLEWKRAKWGRFPKLYYQFAEWIASKTAHRVVSDSRRIQAYYDERWKTPSTFIAYGAHVQGAERPDVLAEYGLEKDGYFFVASRLEPENNADTTVEAFGKVDTDKKLVIAGAANWDSPFVERLKDTDDERVVFLGGVYTPGHIRELHSGCFAYVHGNEVGGTNPALLKAMGYGNCVLSIDVDYNAEVLDGAGRLWRRHDPDHLAEQMRAILDDPGELARCRADAVARIEAAYTWERITEGYERLFENLVAGRYRGRPASD